MVSSSLSPVSFGTPTHEEFLDARPMEHLNPSHIPPFTRSLTAVITWRLPALELVA